MCISSRLNFDYRNEIWPDMEKVELPILLILFLPKIVVGIFICNSNISSSRAYSRQFLRSHVVAHNRQRRVTNGERDASAGGTGKRKGGVGGCRAEFYIRNN